MADYSVRKRKYYIKHKREILQYNRKYYIKHKKEILKKDKRHYRKNKSWIKKRKAKYYIKHRKKIIRATDVWRRKNPIRFKIIKYAYRRRRLKRDINFKLACSLRNRLNIVVRNNQKSGSAVRDLGCSTDYLKQYIQSKFSGKMSWNNWGSVWELDHIKPLCKFDLTDRKQLLKAVHYTNLQPLTIKDHRKKSGKELSKYFND